MISFKPSPENNTVIAQIYRLKESSAHGIRQAFYFIGKDLKQKSQELILSKEKTGKVYLTRLGRVRRNHQSSAAGEAPANFTGNLRRSIAFEVRGAEQLEFGSRSGTKADPYAQVLEEGGSKVAARPYLKPSFDLNEGNIYEHFERELEKGLSK